MNKWELKEKKCLCQKGRDTVLYPQRIDWSTFSSYEFSARRDRGIQHYRIVRCDHCGLVRSDPILPEDVMEALYEDCKFLSEKESALAAATYASLAQKFLTGGPERQERSLLEIGCGNGAFLDAMLRLGIKHVVGCEPTRDALSFASAEVRPSIINDHFKPGHFKPETFDMVCAFHVLDHLSDPDEFVRESRRILKRGGRVLFICHDVDAMVNRVFRESSPVFDIEHIFLFNKSTLAALTENSGFDVISVGDLRNTYTVAYWLKYAPFLKKFVRFLPTVIKDRRLTLAAGNIFVCATKK